MKKAKKEDITEIMGVAEMIAMQINQLAAIMTERIDSLDNQIRNLEKEVALLRK